MADEAVAHVGENSPEEIAYRLYRDILRAENRADDQDRVYILNTYAECLYAVRGHRQSDWRPRTV